MVEANEKFKGLIFRTVVRAIVLFVSFMFSNALYAQPATVKTYIRKSYMVPMRDGTKLFCALMIPHDDTTTSYPFLIQRTPYSSNLPFAEDSVITIENFFPNYKSLAEGGYIFVWQDLRGKFKSEGTFEMNRPLYHLTDKTKTDESTDAWDTIDWLVKNIKYNSGKAGIFGISYPGYLALDAAVDPHPALKASSPQASPADMFLGDDFHHNGAFRLSYGFEYSYLVENDKESNSIYPFPSYDVFDWYLKLGSLKNVNEKYYHNRLPSWNDFAKHPNYDSFWVKQSLLTSVHVPQIPLLQVGGYYDQEDLNGPQIMYSQLEKKDSFNRNYIVLGPWDHGGWRYEAGDSLGKISFGSKTGWWFKALQKQWFDYWLKGIGKGKFSEANCFQTGTNVWKTYSTWPPVEAEPVKLYTHADGTCSFTRPTEAEAAVSYISDPAKPVPYRARPVEATYGEGSRWEQWHTEDQRFATSRPDVVSFVSDSVKKNFTVTGDVKAHIFVSTTGTDADFVVKLIDVFPDKDTAHLQMSGYEWPVAMEVFRGRFRKSFSSPQPFTPNQPEEITIDLHQINHTFLPGHKMMIQVQSTWFPIIDRNPQKYVANIFEAKESDFIKATETVHCNSKSASYIELPVMKE